MVEDNDDDADMTMHAIKKYHLADRVVRLRDGQEALDYFFGARAAEARRNGMPRLVLLDINVPKVSGLEVLRQLRARIQTSILPVIFLTSSAEANDLHRAYELNVSGYIVKPVNFEKFVEAIREIGMYWLVHNRLATR